MERQSGGPQAQAVSPSAAAEVAWLLSLLLEKAPHTKPAIAELEASLLPGLAALREPTSERFLSLWDDGGRGCPELLVLAHHAGALLEPELDPFLRWLARATNHEAPRYELITEPLEVRGLIASRLCRICREGTLRLRYRDAIEGVWRLARIAWRREGKRTATAACEKWRARIGSGGHIDDLVAPRHPLTRADQLGWEDLWAQREAYVLSPLYFCLSGGQVTDLGEYVHITVPASDLLPIRRIRDAMFVADRLRVLAEPTRVHILIQLMSTPSGVMDVARALRVSQPTVSAHVKVLRDAGLIQQRRMRTRNVFVASRKRVERLLEDARGTLARWD